VPVLGAVLVVLLFLSDVYVRVARAERAGPPAERLEDARRAERLNPLALAPRYLQAGALEALGRRDDARRELLAALDREPRSFVTLGLLGDLELRAGRREAAREWYRRALALNPMDTGLRELAG
jgi:tetratricopeptide (TPR) repeat protein